MSVSRPIGAPRRADVQRLRNARRVARLAVAEAEARCAAERVRAFRLELASTIRAASPVLLSLLEVEGRDLGDVAERLVPTPGWPWRPRLSRVVGGWGLERHALRCASAEVLPGRFPKTREMTHGAEFPLKGAGWARAWVAGHSLEVTVRIGPATFETRHGELRITVPAPLPLTLAGTAAGRLLDDVLLSPITVGRGWRVTAVENDAMRAVVVVTTGNVPCTIGWGAELWADDAP